MRYLSLAVVFVASLLVSIPLHAQEPGGVRLGLRYQTVYQPGLVVLPFATEPGAERDGELIRGIIRQDLDFSDRFALKEAGASRSGEPVNLALWKQRGADYVLEGTVTPGAGGFALELVLHDAVYGTVKGTRIFALPPAGSPAFRMAVHEASDEVVRWATGEPGMAASRIAFVLEGEDSKEIYVVDSDGENVRRITNDGSIALSPAWSPGADRIAFTSYRDGAPALYEAEVGTGQVRLISDRQGLNITPAYSPDGRMLAFATTVDGSTELAILDIQRSCCLQQLTEGGRFDSLSPSFSPDGSRVAFVSNRLGQPHIYVMPLGGEPRLISQYSYGQNAYNTSPDWSPDGNQVVYHSRINGVPQLMAVSSSGGSPRLLTNEGRNEDPSWAPDGRHVVFSSPNRDGGGLFVLDTVSGRVRVLLRGQGYGLPAWSPSLGTRTSLSAR